MTLQIGDVAENFAAETGDCRLVNALTHNGNASKDLLQVMADATACSPRVFYGLLAWASLDPHDCHGTAGVRARHAG